MAYRFTNTEKWQDSWFSNLSQIEMLLFLYLCDNCDIAGFIEINFKRWASDLNSSKETIEGACKGLARGLIFSLNYECIFIKNYLKHQKNLPLNENNKAHIGILKRFDLYSNKFDIHDVNEFIEGACKGLQSPTGNGIGNGIGNGKIKEVNFDFKNSLISIGVDEIISSDWLKVRKAKKAVNTETAFNAIKHQIELSGLTANECIKIAVEKNWSGFRSEWIKKEETNFKHHETSFPQ